MTSDISSCPRAEYSSAISGCRRQQQKRTQPSTSSAFGLGRSGQLLCQLLVEHPQPQEVEPPPPLLPMPGFRFGSAAQSSRARKLPKLPAVFAWILRPNFLRSARLGHFPWLRQDIVVLMRVSSWQSSFFAFSTIFFFFFCVLSSVRLLPVLPYHLHLELRISETLRAASLTCDAPTKLLLSSDETSADLSLMWSGTASPEAQLDQVAASEPECKTLNPKPGNALFRGAPPA